MTTRRRVAIATCREWPDLSASDALLGHELERRGHDVVALPWNAVPIGSFTSTDIVVVRSTWDYHHELAAFEDWLSAVDGSDAELHNSAEVIKEQNNKSYLLRLADLGIPVPATLALDEVDTEAIRSWMSSRGFKSAVFKPAWGASGHDVQRVTASGLDDATACWKARPDRRGLVVQEFMPQIRDGEFALVFFAGKFSHALHRRAIANDFRVNSQYGGTISLADRVDRNAIALACRVLGSLAALPTYARIDVVGSGDTLALMEVEVNEPALGLDLAPGSAARFADALLHN